MRPSYIPVPDSIKSQNHSSSRSIPLQVWQRSESCPNGTIPIRRVSKQDLLKFYDLERFGRKNPQFVNTSESDNRQGRGDRTVVINDGTVSLGPQVNLSVRNFPLPCFLISHQYNTWCLASWNLIFCLLLLLKQLKCTKSFCVIRALGTEAN